MFGRSPSRQRLPHRFGAIDHEIHQELLDLRRVSLYGAAGSTPVPPVALDSQSRVYDHARGPVTRQDDLIGIPLKRFDITDGTAGRRLQAPDRSHWRQIPVLVRELEGMGPRCCPSTIQFARFVEYRKLFGQASQRLGGSEYGDSRPAEVRS